MPTRFVPFRVLPPPAWSGHQGVLGLPFVLKVNGLGAGVILIIMGAIFADITLRLLHLDNLLSRATTYEGIGSCSSNRPSLNPSRSSVTLSI